MNPHILMVLDHNLNTTKYTKEQLEQNADDAYVAAVAIAAANAAADDATDDEDAFWLDRYFRYTGENKQDYIDEINKDNRSRGRMPTMSVGYGAENKQENNND